MQRDPEVREERGDDRALRLVRSARIRSSGRHYSMIPPRVIASTSRARSSSASVISLRARARSARIDLPVRVRLLDDLGRGLVADVRVERGADRRATPPRSARASRCWPRSRRCTSRRTRVHTLASRSIDSSRLRAITGTNTLSSKLPCEPAERDRRRRCRSPARRPGSTTSGITGLTLPGMIDEPGCRSGMRISARPVRGPLAIQRRSLAILISDDRERRAADRSSRPARRARPARRSGPWPR